MRISLSHVILDSARMLGQIDKAKELNQQHVSLYRGESEEALASVAPYLFTNREGSAFSQWLHATGWGGSWGIYFYSEAPMAELRQHFRKFLLVQTEEDQELYFRFYDPRVLRIFLPTCDDEQLKEIFGPVQYYVIEDKDPSYSLLFFLHNRHLETQRIHMEENRCF